MSRVTRVAVLGLGPIGRAVATEILAAPDLRLVGAIDPGPALRGRPLVDVLGANAPKGRVAASADDLDWSRVDVAVHMAASRFLTACPQLESLVERGVHVVSTCEELIAAPFRWPKPARALDQRARAKGVSVTATGVNPGFVMDLLPAALATVCVEVRSVRVRRWVDTSTRREALQNKTGAGITRREFRERAGNGTVGHVGLRDSLEFLIGHLPLDATVEEETLRPIVAKADVRVGRRSFARGAVLGVHQTVRARDGAGRVVATFDLKMAYGLENPHDEIRITGDPGLHVRIDGGVPGDRATVGAVLSSIRGAIGSPPGLAG
jgi:4-hydroxy-tetrahydrodipicolinate reductase